MLGDLAEPFHRFGLVTGHPAAFRIRRAKIELRPSKSLLGGLTIPFHRLGLVAGQPAAFRIPHTEIVLCLGIPLLSGLAGIFKRIGQTWHRQKNQTYSDEDDTLFHGLSLLL
ncbi:MAG TPA: hypothetical protein VES89_00480 [Candidatus Competibacteraceae bacterium]|nr:hypothetical protein [Candidatus Competibacteraceae bacterium]